MVRFSPTITHSFTYVRGESKSTRMAALWYIRRIIINSGVIP